MKSGIYLLLCSGCLSLGVAMGQGDPLLEEIQREIRENPELQALKKNLSGANAGVIKAPATPQQSVRPQRIIVGSPTPAPPVSPPKVDPTLAILEELQREIQENSEIRALRERLSEATEFGSPNSVAEPSAPAPEMQPTPTPASVTPVPQNIRPQPVASQPLVSQPQLTKVEQPMPPKEIALPTWSIPPAPPVEERSRVVTMPTTNVPSPPPAQPRPEELVFPKSTPPPSPETITQRPQEIAMPASSVPSPPPMPPQSEELVFPEPSAISPEPIAQRPQEIAMPATSVPSPPPMPQQSEELVFSEPTVLSPDPVLQSRKKGTMPAASNPSPPVTSDPPQEAAVATINLSLPQSSPQQQPRPLELPSYEMPADATEFPPEEPRTNSMAAPTPIEVAPVAMAADIPPEPVAQKRKGLLGRIFGRKESQPISSPPIDEPPATNRSIPQVQEPMNKPSPSAVAQVAVPKPPQPAPASPAVEPEKPAKLKKEKPRKTEETTIAEMGDRKESPSILPSVRVPASQAVDPVSRESGDVPPLLVPIRLNWLGGGERTTE